MKIFLTSEPVLYILVYEMSANFEISWQNVCHHKHRCQSGVPSSIYNTPLMSYQGQVSQAVLPADRTRAMGGINAEMMLLLLLLRALWRRALLRRKEAFLSLVFNTRLIYISITKMSDCPSYPSVSVAAISREVKHSSNGS